MIFVNRIVYFLIFLAGLRFGDAFVGDAFLGDAFLGEALLGDALEGDARLPIRPRAPTAGRLAFDFTRGISRDSISFANISFRSWIADVSSSQRRIR